VRIAGVRPNEELREDDHQNRSSKQLDVIADKADHVGEKAAAGTKSGSDAIGKTEAPIPTPPNAGGVETPRKRSWWRRLVG
jgi:hypothetical protein